MTGNFGSLLKKDCSIDDGSYQAHNESVLNDPQYPANLKILGANTMYPTHQIQFQYFTDAQKQNQTSKPDPETGIWGEFPQLYWATVWTVPFSSPLNQGENQSSTDDIASVGLANMIVGIGSISQEGSAGILSCETNLSEIVSLVLL